MLPIQEHAEDFPAVEAAFTAVRDRPQGALAGHVLGYLGPISREEVGRDAYAGVQDTALVGRGGVEQTYERALRGVDGVQELLVDRDGGVTGIAGTTAPVPGDGLVLASTPRSSAWSSRSWSGRCWRPGSGRTTAAAGPSPTRVRSW